MAKSENKSDYLLPVIRNPGLNERCTYRNTGYNINHRLKRIAGMVGVNKYLKKIAEKAEIEKPLSMHISRHSFAHIAQEAGAESSAIKNILGHSNLATTERYMGSFDTSKTDNTLRTLFKKKATSKQTRQEEVDVAMTKEDQAIQLLKGMTPEQIMAVISAINK